MTEPQPHSTPFGQYQLIEKIAKTKLSRKEIPSAAEVKRARQRIIKEDISEVIENGEHTPYLDVIRQLSEAMDAEEIAAAALSIAFGDMEVAEIQKFVPAGHAREKGMTRLFLTIGRKDRIQTAEILRTIAEEAGIPGKRVGKIDIMDNFTFVEVPSDIAERVIMALDNAVVKGRKVSVEKAKPHGKAPASYPKKKRKY